MTWQDILIALCTVVFNFALIPTIKSKKNKPAFSTSLITGILNIAIGVAQLTLALWFSAITTFINAALWLILAYQKAIRK